MQRIRVALLSGVQTAQAPGLALAMAERRGGLGARLVRLLAGLGVRRERRGKETSEEATSGDRPWSGQSCPDLAQGQGSTSNVSLKARAQSASEGDLRASSHGGFWIWKRQRISGGPAQPLGRLQRPAVGSASDLASHASVGPESLALAVASAEPAGTRHPPFPGPTPGHWEQGSPGCARQQPPDTAPAVPLRPEPPGNLEDAPMLPRPASFSTAEGAKGKPGTPGPAPREPAQTLHTRPSARRTRYCITVTLQGLAQAPGEEGEEPAQPAPHPCGPEESRGWREPPQGPRPITGCPTAQPWEPRLRARRHRGSAAQRQELRASRTPGSLRRRLPPETPAALPCPPRERESLSRDDGQAQASASPLEGPWHRRSPESGRGLDERLLAILQIRKQ
ncbi:collagen alpha-1(I) chain-like [Lemur catta]|uniref:collagen alpha-1(I) chain-like n=1 Tax=Lemur catta TaxID=9447 RepID=UPI001E26B10F|nr:collagen alpha-1(I) chain-like [Lemur catta]